MSDWGVDEEAVDCAQLLEIVHMWALACRERDALRAKERRTLLDELKEKQELYDRTLNLLANQECPECAKRGKGPQ